MSAGLKFGLGSLGLLTIGAFASGSVPSIKSLPNFFTSSSSKSAVAEAGSKKEEKIEKVVTPEKIVQEETTPNLVRENIESVVTTQVSEEVLEITPIKEEAEATNYQALAVTQETRAEEAMPKTEERVLAGESQKESRKPSSRGKGDGIFCSNLLGIWRVRYHDQCDDKTKNDYWQEGEFDTK